MKLIFYLSVLLMFLSYSCRKDSKDDTSFLEIDPCENVNCINGECLDGSCICEDGFSGIACDTTLAPDSIFIHSITFSGNQSENNYAMWEGESKSLNCIIEHDNDSLYVSSTEVIHPMDSGIWILEEPIVITEVLEQYEIQIYDEQVEYLYGLSFQLFRESNTVFPNNIELSTPTGSIKFELDVSYSWE